ncbi:MAG TPA: patatin-like phospholipase family protein, partial [Patescibacteria group bacterium]|nr:patatin-like phospholipase family protein [Patescibacteria group bacterium]
GGARGAAQVGVLQALFEAGVDPPVAVVGTSVGALNGSVIAAYPSLAGVLMLREVWTSRQAAAVFQANPLSLIVHGLRSDRLSALPQTNVKRLIERAQTLIGVDSFKQLRLPLAVVATDLNAGIPAVFRSGDLMPALLASTAIPALFPAVKVEDRAHLDGAVVDNTPIDIAVADGSRHVLAISLMGGGEFDPRPTSLPDLIARTLQLSLHHQMLSDFERLRRRARVVVLCPITPQAQSWEMKSARVRAVMDSARSATAKLLNEQGSDMFKRSAIHYFKVD